MSVVLAETGLCSLLLLIVVAVKHGWTDVWDRSILLAFRHQGDLTRGVGPLWFGESVRDITGLGSNSVLVIVIVVAAAFMLAAGWRNSFVTLIGAIASAEGVCLALKEAVSRPRPDFIPDTPSVFTTSFPSSHAMVSVLTYALLAALMAQRVRRQSLQVTGFMVAGSLTVLVGLSRIYLGVHYPTDVLAGWTAGLALALLCWRIAAPWCARDEPQVARQQQRTTAVPGVASGGESSYTA